MPRRGPTTSAMAPRMNAPAAISCQVSGSWRSQIPARMPTTGVASVEIEDTATGTMRTSRFQAQ